MSSVGSPFVLVLVLTVAAAAVASQDAPGDYPQWRGRDRDGGASLFAEPVAWPEALNRRWHTEVGEGYATPLVVGNVVYALTRIDGREGISALDASTGALRWRSDYPAPYSPAGPASAHGAGPKATPLFYQGRLFTLGITGIAAAFDPASGKVLWQTAAPAEAPYFSAASSPVGSDGLVLVHPGNYEPLTAFDAASGAVRWAAGPEGFFMSPVVATLSGTRQAVTVTTKAVIGVSLAEGRLLWQFPWPGGGAGGIMPIINGDTIIVSATGMGTIAVKPVKREDAWVVERLWETKDVSMYVSNPVAIDDTLFGLSERASGQFFALDTRNGNVLWLGPPREARNTAVAKARDILFLLNDDGELIVARGSRQGLAVIRRYTVADGPTWAQPAISGNRFFIKDRTTLNLWTID